ncbi:hypothetical protein P7E02_06435 [Enterococcus hulanensis]|uniref:hypothetical protein n=1 Tax=Enterococcus hulanensis TaxID=2559929 RepID=UPI00288EA1A8|nr:hypothetical protein [Enterococcus hulanensis]MDT2659496.1 hypothetical protein [Enterococcus hulanensis]
MDNLFLNKLMKSKHKRSVIWGVPIKTKGKIDENSKKVEVIIQKILSNQKLTENETLLLKNRVLGNWTISETNVDETKYLIAIYYYLKKQTIIAIYEVNSSNKEEVPIIVDSDKKKNFTMTEKNNGKRRFRWTDGQSLPSILNVKNCYVGQTIENLHNTFNHPQRLIFK